MTDQCWVGTYSVDYEGIHEIILYSDAEDAKKYFERQMRRRKDRPVKWLMDKEEACWFYRQRGAFVTYEIRLMKIHGPMGSSDDD